MYIESDTFKRNQTDGERDRETAIEIETEIETKIDRDRGRDREREREKERYCEREKDTGKTTMTSPYLFQILWVRQPKVWTPRVLRHQTLFSAK